MAEQEPWHWPPVPAAERISQPDVAVHFVCPSCGLHYLVDDEAMHSERLPRFAFQVWGHYHIFRNPGHENWTGRDALKSDDHRTIVMLREQDLREALTWWAGFRLGQRVAAEELAAPIEAKLQELRR